MAQDFFIKVLNLSYQGGIAICVVILASFLLHMIKAPKKYAYYLWLFAFVRLVLPFSFESVFSVLPEDNEPIKSAIVYEQRKGIPTENVVVNSSVDVVLNPVVNPAADKVVPEVTVPETSAATPEASANPLQNIIMIAQVVWFVGIGILVIASAISFVRLKKRLVGSVQYVQESNAIYLSDYIETAFVLGFFRPRIYVPSSIAEREMSYIIMHEQAHIKRKDNIIKLFLFAITVIHWFNPLVWLAYVLAIQDMEMSCDEYVMKNYALSEYDGDIRKEYATSLLSLAAGKKLVLGMPLAFGEGNVKGRIKNVARYKKPLISVVVCAAIACIVVGVALLSNPKSTSTFDKVVTEVDSIEMENIDSIVVHMGDNENTFSAVHAKDFVTFFKSLKVKKKEVNKSHEESIEKEISVTITYGEDSEESDTFYITDEMIWFDDGVKSSYSYQIVDFEEVETFIESKFEDTSSYGIAPPIESLSWGMSVDECKKNLANYTFELISNEGGLMYRVSSEMSLFDYTDEIDQVILKFDSAITEPVYPYHTDALTSIQFIFHEIDVDKMKDKVTDLVGAEGTHWVDIRKSDFITWESVDTVKNLDKASYKLLEDFWTLLDEYALDSFLAASKEASELINRVDMSDGLLTARKENSEPINKVKMQYTEDGICSVEFYAGMNLFLYNLR